MQKENNSYIVALSGGVDSSVAAFLLKKQGIKIMGATMRLMDGQKEYVPGRCCSDSDINDARMICGKLNIPFDVFDYREEFKDYIIEKFACDYEAGLTPNPCIECNRYMKFSKMLADAKKLGFYGIATGHYARVVYDEAVDRYLLKKSKDDGKDQSYVLYMLTQDELSHIKFPLGDYRKEETRKIADQLGFVNANKPDSQDICFVPDGDYAKFISEYRNVTFPPGKIIDEDGNVLGEHKGALCYTLGQRKGLGLALGKPVFVYEKSMSENTVTIGPEEKLFKTKVRVRDLNWISIAECKESFRAKAKLRYSQKEAECTVEPLSGQEIELIFNKPQRAPAPGQAAVIYDGDTVVGGGVIY